MSAGPSSGPWSGSPSRAKKLPNNTPWLQGSVEALQEDLDRSALSTSEMHEMEAALRGLADRLAARKERVGEPEISDLSPLRWLEGTELLEKICGELGPGDALCACFACRRLRDAVFRHFPIPASGYNRRFPPEATEITSHVGSVSRFMWARANGPSSIRDGAWHLRATTVCDAAAAAGSLGVLVKARELGYAWSERTCAAAAEGGSIETLEWLRSTSKQPRKERCPWDVRVCAEAARRGHLELLVWARKRKCKWDERTCLLAANSGHLHVLKWARSRGAPWDGELLMEALRGGDRRRVRKPTDPPDNHYETFVWAIENGAPVDDEQLLYEVAAAVGSLPVLNYLKDQYGGAWRSPEEWRQLLIDAITHIHSGPVSAAAMNGHVDVLEWLHNIAMEHANSVPGFALPEYFFEQIVSRAASNSRDPVAVLRWCHEKGHTDFRPTLVRGLILSHRETSLDVLKFLHSVDAPWLPDGESAKLAISRNLVEKLKWLIEEAGCVWGDNPLVHGRPYQDAYKWAESHGAPARQSGGAGSSLHELGHVPFDVPEPPHWALGPGGWHNNGPGGMGPPPGAMLHFGAAPEIPPWALGPGGPFGPHPAMIGGYSDEEDGSAYDDYDGHDFDPEYGDHLEEGYY